MFSWYRFLINVNILGFKALHASTGYVMSDLRSVKNIQTGIELLNSQCTKE